MSNEMPNTAPKDEVYWYKDQHPDVIKLERDVTADAVVVGGGAAGLAAAQVLSAAGKSVVLVEADVCGAGASGKSSGFITPDSELEFSDLVERFGEADGCKLWQFAEGGLERMRENIRTYNLACDYIEQDSLFIAKNKRGISLVEDEYAIQKKAGFSVQLYHKTQLPAIIGSDTYYAGVRASGTYGINTYQYCQQFKKVLAQQGIGLYERSPVTELRSDGVQCGKYKITAQYALVCTDRFLPDLGLAKSKVYHAQTFLGLTAPVSENDARALFPNGPLMVWDTDLIYQYFRLTGERRLLIGSADLTYTYWPKEIHGSRRMARKLANYLKNYFPNIPFTLEYLWPGLIGISKDFAPIAGQSRKFKNVYFAGVGAGLPWATALGQYVAQKALEGRDDLDKFLSPGRKFPVPDGMQTITTKPVGFALSHGLVKYKKYL
jgi:gamma-glutamylputrescine oxidase